MKRFAILFIMAVLAGVGFGDVYLVKSKFTPNYWQAFIPADDTGEYYLQVGFGVAIDSSANLPNVSILDMTYGKLCDAKQYPLLNTDGTPNTTDYTFPVAWDPVQRRGLGEYVGMGENGNAGTSFVTLDLPDTHNEVHLLFEHLASYTATDDLAISWSDDSTTDLLATGLGTDNGIREIILLKGTAVGSRILKLKPKVSRYVRLIGVRSWDSTAKGNLATDLNDCLITQFTNVGIQGLLCRQTTSTCINSTNTFALLDTLTSGEAIEPAFAWDSGGTDYDFTGANTHYAVAATNNVYTMAAAYLASDVGPEIFVDGVSKGGMFNDHQYAGTHLTGANSASLVDTSQNWTVDALIGLVVYNRYDGCHGTITDNDATTCTVAGGLSGGTDNDFDVNDSYYIVADPVGNVRGTSYSGDRIVIKHKGTIAGATSGTAPNCDWSYIIDDSGLNVMVTVTWQSDIAFAGTPAIYTPQFPMNTALASSQKLRWPLSDTETAVPIGTAKAVTYTGKSAVCELVHNQFVIRLISFSPVTQWLYNNISSANKLYGWVIDSFPGAPTPASGDVMTLGGKYEVRRIKSNGSEYWQNISGGKSTSLNSSGGSTLNP